MSMIFPGMDPYLEDPVLFHGFHQRLVVYLADHLQPLLRPRYIAAVEERVFVEGPEDRQVSPDVYVVRRRNRAEDSAVAVLEPDAPEEIDLQELEVHESYIAILDRNSGQRVVTVIEVVSPSNKFAGSGRNSYVQKQQEVRHSDAHLVEIDLLRTGRHVLLVPEWQARGRGDYDYLVCVNRAKDLRKAVQIYRGALRKRLPRIRSPLAGDDPDVVLDLQAVVAHAYEIGAYRDRISYDRPCVPPLPPEDQSWANELIRNAGVLGTAS